MTQQLRIFAAGVKDPGSGPSPIWRLATICSSGSRKSDTHFCLPQTLCMCGTLTGRQNVKINKSFLKFLNLIFVFLNGCYFRPAKYSGDSIQAGCYGLNCGIPKFVYLSQLLSETVVRNRALKRCFKLK